MRLGVSDWKTLGDAPTDQISGLPKPVCGRFVQLTRSRKRKTPTRASLALVWEFEGIQVFARTGDGLLLLGDYQEASWLPRGWRTNFFPAGWSWQHIERWLQFAIEFVETPNPNPGVNNPSARQLVTCAYMIAPHLRLANAPMEPVGAMSPQDCQTHLRNIRAFLQQQMARSASANASSVEIAAPTYHGNPTANSAGQVTAPNPRDGAIMALLQLFTNGVADIRIGQASAVLADDGLTANDKLNRIDRLIPFPATASAERLAEALGVSKQAVLKTSWWRQNRKGEKQNEIGRRLDMHKRRAKNYEPPGTADDDN